MSDVVECLYIRFGYIRVGMHGRDRKPAGTNKNMSDVAKIVIYDVVIPGVHCTYNLCNNVLNHASHTYAVRENSCQRENEQWFPQSIPVS